MIVVILRGRNFTTPLHSLDVAAECNGALSTAGKLFQEDNFSLEIL